MMWRFGSFGFLAVIVAIGLRRVGTPTIDADANVASVPFGTTAFVLVGMEQQVML